MAKVSSNRFAWLPAIVTFICLECLVGLQAVFANQDHFLTIAQMKGRGISQGLPFVWHFAMWSDFFVISPLAAYVTGRTFSQWRQRRILATLAVGVVSAITLSVFYMFLSSFPEAHVQNFRLTHAGVAHAIYLAIAVSVFIQFLCFTDGVSLGLLRTVSILLLLHVFIGTHMALGIIKLYYPLDWYPAQPLESFFGWATVIAVGIGLAERNVGLGVVLWFVDLPNPKTDEGYLKLLDFACKIVNRSYFTFMAGLALGRGDNFLSIVLIVLLGFIYYLSRLSVWQELAIGKTLYPSDPDRIPDDLKMKSRLKIAGEVFVFMAAYVASAWTAHCILVVSFLMFVIACFDLNTRRQINNGIRANFNNRKYLPREDDPDFQEIMDRREKAKRYLFGRPHLQKEAARIICYAVAFGIANLAYFSNVPNVAFHGYLFDMLYCSLFRMPDGVGNLAVFAYLVLIATLVWNEIITIRWRLIRDIDFGRLEMNDRLRPFLFGT
jgi:hypothetical protein